MGRKEKETRRIRVKKKRGGWKKEEIRGRSEEKEIRRSWKIKTRKGGIEKEKVRGWREEKEGIRRSIEKEKLSIRNCGCLKGKETNQKSLRTT